ncbi:MAG: OmpA family protein [Syntrophus sp. (in: bacteria)]|nr:OmpA family protein [Syntrophus sp. (in: bacteria)]
MKKAIVMIFVSPLLLFFLFSCAVPKAKIIVLKPAPKKNLFVLLADPDGTIGKIAVSNQGGTQILDKPGYVTEVQNVSTLPAPPHPMDEKEIARIFGAALSAQPAPPVTYILYFMTGTSDLTEESTKTLPDIFATIAERKSSDISVVGHSDTVGAKQRNQEISYNRAQRVKDFLVSMGLDPRSVSTESHGEDNPLIKTADEVAEPRNRRVEVTVR